MYFLMDSVSIGTFLNDLVLYHLKYIYILIRASQIYKDVMYVICAINEAGSIRLLQGFIVFNISMNLGKVFRHTVYSTCHFRVIKFSICSSQLMW